MFEQALAQALRLLDRAQRKELLTTYGLIGGLAVSRWSTPRMTSDIDFFMALGDSDPAVLARELKGSFRKGDLRDPLLSTITFSVSLSKGSLPIQLVQFPPAWERIAIKDLRREVIEKLELPIVDWKALVLLKLYAGSALDLEDAKNILLVMRPTAREREYLRSQAQARRVSRRLNAVFQ